MFSSLLTGERSRGDGSLETFSSFAAYCMPPTSSAPIRVSTAMTVGSMSTATQFSVERKNFRISKRAWKPYLGRTW
jgi:hypothetical protein